MTQNEIDRMRVRIRMDLKQLLEEADIPERELFRKAVERFLRALDEIQMYEPFNS